MSPFPFFPSPNPRDEGVSRPSRDEFVAPVTPPSSSSSFATPSSPSSSESDEDGLIPVFPMDSIQVCVDQDSQAIVVMMASQGIQRLPVMMLDATGAVRLIQGLRSAIKEVEKLPPLASPSHLRY